MNRTRRTRRRRLAMLAFAMLATVSLGAGAFSLALFTDVKTVTANTFTTGTIVLGVNPATALLTSANMMPGDTVTNGLVVSNAGTGALRYAMTGASTNADAKNLMNQIVLTVKTLGTSCAAFDGTTLYTGNLVAPFFGDPATGAQAGDRALASGVSETLCFRANLPLATGNTFQNATTTTTFTFTAEQTANNP